MSLSACAAGVETASVAPAASSPGNWRIERRADSIAGANSTAVLPLNYSANFLTGELRTGELRLLCFKRQPVVRIAFNYKIGSNKTAALAYRFDDNPGHEAEARFLQDYKTVVIEDLPEVGRFLAELKSANKLFVRIDSLTIGRTNIELGVEGAPAAIDAALAQCPLSAAQPERRA